MKIYPKPHSICLRGIYYSSFHFLFHYPYITEGSFQASKTMTVTRMAAPKGPHPCFEALGIWEGGGRVGTRSADAYTRVMK